MTFILIFAVAMLAISTVIWAMATGLRFVDRRVEQWPLLWATALWMCVIVPALGLLLSLLPSAASHEAFSVFSLHDPLQSLGLMAGDPVEVTGEVKTWTFAQFKIALVGLYVGGVLLTLTKLAWGRYRIHRLILKAECADIAGQDDVLISPVIQSPFAWTPFGRPQHSRILLPQSYRGVVSEAQVLDILTHERAHIIRRDDEWGLAMRVLLCLCWVSPFAHRLFASWSQATEIQCDMAVTAHRDPKMRKAYADILVKALHIVAGRVQQYPAASFSTHRIRNEKMRIKHIMDGTQPAFKRLRDKLVLSVVAASVTAVGVLAISVTATADPADKTSTVNTVVTSMVSGRLTARFGPTSDPFNAGKTRKHFGIDIAASTGTPVFAPEKGIIRAATNAYRGNRKYGNVVAIETAGGVMTMFAHLEGYTVVEGQKVSKGMQIATVGSSGKSTEPHVHIETRQNGKLVDPESIWDIASND